MNRASDFQSYFQIFFVVFLSGCANFSSSASHLDVPYRTWATEVPGAEAIVVRKNGAIFVNSKAEGGVVYEIEKNGERKKIFENIPRADGLLLDPQGTLYISTEVAGGKVFALRPNGTQETLLEGLQKPEGMALDSKQRLYIAEDVEGGDILRWTPKGKEVFAKDLYRPENLTFDKEENLYVSETNKSRILKISPKGERSVFARRIRKPDGLTYCETYGGLFVAEDQADGRIIFFDLKHKKRKVIAQNLYFPQSMACDDGGNIYALEKEKGKILYFGAKDLIKILSVNKG